MEEQVLPNIPPDVIELDPADINSMTWHKLQEYLTRRRASLRVQNDNPKLTAEETCVIRASIREVSLLLKLGEPKVPPVFIDPRRMYPR